MSRGLLCSIRPISRGDGGAETLGDRGGDRGGGRGGDRGGDNGSGGGNADKLDVDGNERGASLDGDCLSDAFCDDSWYQTGRSYVSATLKPVVGNTHVDGIDILAHA